MKRFFTVLFLIFLLGIAPKALLYKGAKSKDVYKIQKGLSRAGYYNGVCDDEYSEKVYEAVRAYQCGNGFYPDGICTYAIARSLGADIKYDQRDEDTVKLARLLCSICKNDDILTKSAVASVAINRLDSPLFPDDMTSVISTMGTAFPCDIPDSCLRVAYEALRGAKPYGDILYFEEAKALPEGVKGVKRGRFVFYK